MSDLRLLPSVDQVLQTEPAIGWIGKFGRALTLQAIRTTLDEIRAEYREGSPAPQQPALLQRMQSCLEKWTAPSLIAVINATGVILHTNLGRAPLSQATLQAIQETACGYSNLEYDLAKGKRGSRLVHAEAILKHLTGAEAALVVNNNASAVLLALSALARRRNVIIARSQLVEIGGGFRVPDVMKQSGARLLEIGTTNRVHLADYAEAIETGSAALVMRAHRSNFKIIGFTSEPELGEIVQAAHQCGIPVIDDLGSGALLDTQRYGLGHEPTVQESLAAGTDLVCFSGDKLLGGPQAGIIVGQSDLVARLRKHPLARAIRADKLCLAGLSATLMHYMKEEAEREIPIWRMISQTAEQIQARALAWSVDLQAGAVIPSQSTVGGGSLPDEILPTFVLALPGPNPARLAEQLRTAQPPVIVRVEKDQVLLDPRTVLIEQEAALLDLLKKVLSAIPLENNATV